MLNFIFQAKEKDLMCCIEYDILEPQKFSVYIENGDIKKLNLETKKDLYEIAKNILKNHYKNEYWVELSF